MHAQLSLVLVNWTARVPDDWGYLVDRAVAARRQLRLDQRLIDRGRRRADPILNLGSLQHFKKLKQGRLIQSHRVMCPFARTIGVVSLTITRWPSPTRSPTPTRPTTYTTSGDITLPTGA